jgi:hypothetical protein
MERLVGDRSQIRGSADWGGTEQAKIELEFDREKNRTGIRLFFWQVVDFVVRPDRFELPTFWFVAG